MSNDNNEQFLNFLLNLQRNQQLSLNDIAQQCAMNQLETANNNNIRQASNMVQNIHYNISLNIPSNTPIERPKSTPPTTLKKRIRSDAIVSPTSSLDSTIDSLENTFTTTVSLEPVDELEETVQPKTRKRSKQRKITREDRILSSVNFAYYCLWFLFSIVNTALMVIDNTESNDVTIPVLYFELYSALSAYISTAYPFMFQKLKDKLQGKYNTNGLK